MRSNSSNRAVTFVSATRLDSNAQGLWATFLPARTLTLSATFSDGSTATATTTVP